MAVELGRITVPNTGGGSASCRPVSIRTYAAATGAEIIVPTSARLPAAAATLQKARALDTGAKFYWDGSAWKNDGVFAQSVSTGTITFSSSASASTTISLPAGRFSVTPSTFAQTVGGTVSAFMYLRIDTKSTSSVQVTAIHRDGTSVSGTCNVELHCVQMTPTAAAG